MIDKSKPKRGKGIKVTFSIPVEWLPQKVAVVGDFNGWDPGANPMRKKGGNWVASVVLEPGVRHRFRYLDVDGRWHDDPAADDVELNDVGAADCIVDLRDLDS
jgi:1,4-alpha-glucan branching enzyme